MSLRKQQSAFTKALGQLILWAFDQGYELTLGDTYPGKFQHSPIGQHPKGLAIDLNLFRDGVYLGGTDDHEPLGNYWEYLSDDARWGGRFSDGNHYEWMPGWRSTARA